MLGGGQAVVVAKVSVIIPSRSEQFLVKTVADVLEKAAGDIEVIPVLDGYWETDLPDDPRVVQLHHGEALGMRPSINHGARVATGEYLLKLDGHCMVAPGFDEVLKADYHERNWVLVPRRYALEPETWTIDETAGHKGKYPIDAHYLSYPYERPDDPTCGMHGTPWDARSAARKDVLIDDEMSSQGSCWFMHREHWARLGELDIARYGNFIQEFQEIGNKTWLGGGAVKVTKNTWYAHLHKGSRYGRGYSMTGFNHEAGRDFCIDYWMNDRWPARVRPLRWLVDQFSPVPGWPADLDKAFATPTPTIAVPAQKSDRPTVEADGSISCPGGRAWLAEHFAHLGFTRGVEVGTEQGEYAEVLCKANPGLDLTCVDAWTAYHGYREHVSQEKLDGFRDATVERLKPYDCTILNAFSVDAARGWTDGSLDFVYIDASHRYEQVVADIAAWEPKVRPGGIVAGHDFRHIKGKAGAVFGVVEAVRGWTKAYGINPWFVLRGDKSPSWMWVKEDSVLRIISAFYGPKADPKTGRDVTGVVQRAVQRNSLELVVGNETLGGDPAPGQGKTLAVTYGTKGGGSDVVTVREGAILTLPKA